MNTIAACIVAGLAGLGAEVVFTGLHERRTYGYSKPWFFWLYSAAPLGVAILSQFFPLPGRLAADTLLLVLVDQAVRKREGEPLLHRLRALRWFYWLAWLGLACILEVIAGAA